MSIPEIIIVSVASILGFSVFIISVYVWIDFELSNKKHSEKIYITDDVKPYITNITKDNMEVRRLYDKVANLKIEDDIDIIWSK